MKDGIKAWVMSQMDSMALPGYFFWTWKVGNSSITGKVEAPFWSYKLGLDNGMCSCVLYYRICIPEYPFAFVARLDTT